MEHSEKIDMMLSGILQGMGVSAEAALALESEVTADYAANGLPYHNLDHIKQTLQVANQLLASRDTDTRFEQTAVFTSLWFHDIVYDPRASDNEEKSADYARDRLQKLAVNRVWIDLVYELIIDTKSHQPQTTAGQVVVDADLSILGMDRVRYVAYMESIHREYAWVPLTAYRLGRGRVLERFLAQPVIYHTLYAGKLWEARARENLQWELARLREE